MVSARSRNHPDELQSRSSRAVYEDCDLINMPKGKEPLKTLSGPPGNIFSVQGQDVLWMPILSTQSPMGIANVS